MKVTINGVAVANTASYWDDLYFSANDGGWEARWNYGAGTIARGQNMVIQAKFTLTRTVKDGFGYTYKPGTTTYDCAVLGQ